MLGITLGQAIETASFILLQKRLRLGQSRKYNP